MATDNTVIVPDLQADGSVRTQNLGMAGFISQESAIAANEQIYTLNQLRNEMIDYIRLRLGDQIVDVELDKEHYELAIKQSLTKYRQKAQNAVEESYVFLDLIPNVQEYIMPSNIMEVRQIFRRGIGSTTGTTASQFEPFASGYLNTYMLVAGRVGGLTNYELFTAYQELAMKMFGGYINYSWNRVTKKLTLMRKIPYDGGTPVAMTALTAASTAINSIITITLPTPSTAFQSNLEVGSSIYIQNCNVSGYSGQYRIATIDGTKTAITVLANQPLAATSVTGNNLAGATFFIPEPFYDGNALESVLLWCYNHKPDSMLLSDPQVYPWLQEYALAFCKTILGQARGKFASIAGPQGGTTLNGSALLAEADAEMAKLEEELKNYVDGSEPLTWITG
jgi:hypothetical protein